MELPSSTVETAGKRNNSDDNRVCRSNRSRDSDRCRSPDVPRDKNPRCDDHSSPKKRRSKRQNLKNVERDSYSESDEEHDKKRKKSGKRSSRVMKKKSSKKKTSDSDESVDLSCSSDPEDETKSVEAIAEKLAQANAEILKLKQMLEAQRTKQAVEDDLRPVRPMPLPLADGHQGKRIPRRGEVGLSEDEIQTLEKLGYVMSGNRPHRLIAFRTMEVNRVSTAEEKRASAEEKAERERKVMAELQKLVHRASGDDVGPCSNVKGADGADD